MARFQEERQALDIDACGFIKDRLPVAPVPGLPDIRLHLAVPQSGVWTLARDGVPPYWAWFWPGGLVLARHIMANPDIVAGRTVLDLGTGSGLVAIAAALSGADRIVACDTDANAIAAVALNAALNSVTVQTQHADLLDGPVPEAEIVLVGDLFYESTLAGRVVAFLDRCLAAHCRIYVGDIGREHLPRDRMQALGSYPLVDFGEPATAEPRPAQVWRYIGART
ncbi:50S ribosomal protein L11 methyltransferase [Pelagibacterium nitratireducens]|uniref:50S ribosomal protein L11 methyltransferase n=1 Tax=Pelagibacterium nitratireducens TaxID=1046114 RepID=A0ABZ2I3K3_9HYPH|tara:strand:+ start:4549 stop:5220 length:672 start_codon:yes stop_codon:yes gene_type:complete